MKKFLKRLALFTTGFYLGGSLVTGVVTSAICDTCGYVTLYYAAIWPYDVVWLWLLN